MDEHSPAPWTWKDDHRQQIRGADGECVAWYVNEHDGPLIALSPDFLKFAQHVAEIMGDSPIGLGARELVAKAKGVEEMG